MSTTVPQNPITLDKQTAMINQPIEYSKRRCTDIFCLVIGILFSLTLVVLSFILFSHDTFAKTSLPSDSSGKVCGVDYPVYPIVYFANPSDFSQRMCVSACPSAGDKKLACTPSGNFGCRFNNAPGFAVTYYDNTYVSDNNGMFCMPTDQTMRANLETQAKLSDRNYFYNSFNTLLICLGIAVVLSIIFLILVQFFPKPMSQAVVYLGFLIVLAVAVLIFLYPTSNTTGKIVVGIVLAILAILILATILCHRSSIKICGAFLAESTRFVKDNPCVLVYIPIFILLLAGFLVMMLQEYRSFMTSGTATFDASSSLYYLSTGTGQTILTVLLVIQFIWGLSFLKEAFNFCVSGNAVYWYLGKNAGCCETFKILVCKHLGSVIASAFMTGFFLPLDLVVDLVKPDTEGGFVNNYLCCGSQILDLVRSDALAYVNLTGNPFCNSSKYCEYLCRESFVMDRNQSTMRTYRICAHLLIAGIASLVGMYISGNIQLLVIGFILAMSVFISTFFIALHADASEAIQIMFLIEEEFSKRFGTSKKFMDFDSISDRNIFLNGTQFHPKHKTLAEDVYNIRKQQWKI